MSIKLESNIARAIDVKIREQATTAAVTAASVGQLHGMLYAQNVAIIRNLSLQEKQAGGIEKAAMAITEVQAAEVDEVIRKNLSHICLELHPDIAPVLPEMWPEEVVAKALGNSGDLLAAMAAQTVKSLSK
jgi:hypothetical protein